MSEIRRSQGEWRRLATLVFGGGQQLNEGREFAVNSLDLLSFMREIRGDGLIIHDQNVPRC